MRKGDPDDPLLRQIWPHAATSSQPVAGFTADPVREQGSRRAGRHSEVSRPRAADRERRVPAALPLLLPPRISVHDAARRSRRLVGGARRVARRARCARGHLERRRSALACRIDASASSWRELADTAVTTVRHSHALSRSSIPERIDDGLVRVLRATRLQTVARRALSITPTSSTPQWRARSRRCSRALTALLNQSVLLRGVNDTAAIARAAQRATVRLRRAAVLPAPARPRRGRCALRRRRNCGATRSSRSCVHACPATWYRGSCARLPVS